MKVLDQLVFFGCLHGLEASEAQKRAVDWAGRMEIADALGRKTEELSKGMQQKIQFIATLLHEPRLIVMDEPFSGLDPVNAVLVEKTLLELKDDGKAILFSTTAWTRSKSSATPSASSTTAAPCSQARCAKSKAATNAIT